MGAVLSISFAALNVNAEKITFDSGNVVGSSFPTLYSKINLENISSVKVIAGDSEDSINGKFSTIESVELVFPYSDNLIVKGLKRINDFEYYGTVEDAWIYKSLTVRMNILNDSSGGDQFDIAVFIDEKDSNIGEVQEPDWESIIYDTSGLLVDSRERKLADTTTVKFEDKDLTLNVYKDLKKSNSQSGIDVSIDWLGHGSADTLFELWYPMEEIYKHKVIAVKITEEDPLDPKVIFTVLENGDYSIDLEIGLVDLLGSSGLSI